MSRRNLLNSFLSERIKYQNLEYLPLELLLIKGDTGSVKQLLLLGGSWITFQHKVPSEYEEHSLRKKNVFSGNLLHAAVIGGRLSALTYLIKWLLERDRIISEDNDEKRSLKNVKKVAKKDEIGKDEKKKYSDMNDKYDDTYDAFVCNDQNSNTESLLHQFLCGVDDHGRTPTDLAKEEKQVSISW